MGFLTSQEREFVSIFIKPTIDLTTTLEPAEKGIVATIGKVSYGNPYYAVVFKSPTEKLKTTNQNAGGSIYNETAFHIADYFRGFNGKVLVGRLLGSDSKTKILKVNDQTEIKADDDINIFNDNNIIDYQDKDSTEAIEWVINTCIAKKFTVQLDVVNIEDDDENEMITVSIFDEYGNKIYSVTGGANYNSVDDYGEPNYVGNLTDTKILTLKVDRSNDDYQDNIAGQTFTLEKTFDNGLVNEDGDLNYPKALEVISNNIEKCDYAFTSFLMGDDNALTDLINITFKAKVPFIVDVYSDDIPDNNPLLGHNHIMAIWNRKKDLFKNMGRIRVGLAGWLAGQMVKRDMSRLVGDVEYKIEGVAGLDYPVPRIKADELPVLSDDDKTKLVKLRINTVDMWDNTLVVSDVLSCNPKNQATRLFPVIDGNYFIERYIARIMKQKFFKNLTEAKLFIKDNVRVLFDRCAKNNYFNSEANPPYTFTVSDKDSDTVIVNYQYVPNGVMRRGIISGILTQKITTSK